MAKEYTVIAVDNGAEFVNLTLRCNGFDLESSPMFPRDADAELICDHTIMWAETHRIPDDELADLAAKVTNAISDSSGLPPETMY